MQPERQCGERPGAPLCLSRCCSRHPTSTELHRSRAPERERLLGDPNKIRRRGSDYASMCVARRLAIVPRPLDRVRLMTLIATPATSTRNGAAPASLAGRLAAGDACAVVTFAGQGVDVLEELAALVGAAARTARGNLAGHGGAGRGRGFRSRPRQGAYRHGVDVAAWVLDPDGAPPPSTCAARRSPIRSACSPRRCCGGPCGRTRSATRSGPARSLALAGHSQGLLAALLVAEAPGGEVDDARLAAHLRRAAVQGLHMSAAADGPLPDGGDRRHLAGAPRAAARRPRLDRARQHARRASSSPGRRRRSIASARGSPSRLAREAAERRDGRRGGAPLRFEWTPLAVDVPFHSPALAEPLARFGERRGLRRRWAPVLGLTGTRRPARSSSSRCAGTPSRGRSARSAPTGCSTSGRAPRSRGSRRRTCAAAGCGRSRSPRRKVAGC